MIENDYALFVTPPAAPSTNKAVPATPHVKLEENLRQLGFKDEKDIKTWTDSHQYINEKTAADINHYIEKSKKMGHTNEDIKNSLLLIQKHCIEHLGTRWVLSDFFSNLKVILDSDFGLAPNFQKNIQKILMATKGTSYEVFKCFNENTVLINKKIGFDDFIKILGDIQLIAAAPDNPHHSPVKAILKIFQENYLDIAKTKALIQFVTKRLKEDHEIQTSSDKGVREWYPDRAFENLRRFLNSDNQEGDARGKLLELLYKSSMVPAGSKIDDFLDKAPKIYESLQKYVAPNKIEQMLSYWTAFKGNDYADFLEIIFEDESFGVDEIQKSLPVFLELATKNNPKSNLERHSARQLVWFYKYLKNESEFGTPGTLINFLGSIADSGVLALDESYFRNVFIPTMKDKGYGTFADIQKLLSQIHNVPKSFKNKDDMHAFYENLPELVSLAEDYGVSIERFDMQECENFQDFKKRLMAYEALTLTPRQNLFPKPPEKISFNRSFVFSQLSPHQKNTFLNLHKLSLQDRANLALLCFNQTDKNFDSVLAKALIENAQQLFNEGTASKLSYYAYALLDNLKNQPDFVKKNEALIAKLFDKLVDCVPNLINNPKTKDYGFFYLQLLHHANRHLELNFKKCKELAQKYLTKSQPPYESMFKNGKNVVNTRLYYNLKDLKKEKEYWQAELKAKGYKKLLPEQELQLFQSKSAYCPKFNPKTTEVFELEKNGIKFRVFVEEINPEKLDNLNLAFRDPYNDIVVYTGHSLSYGIKPYQTNDEKIFFTATCWGGKTIGAEARSEALLKLHTIGPRDKTDTGLDMQYFFGMLDGISEKQNYDQIEKRIEKDPNFIKEGFSSTNYFLPHEAEYADYVQARVSDENRRQGFQPNQKISKNLYELEAVHSGSIEKALRAAGHELMLGTTYQLFFTDKPLNVVRSVKLSTTHGAKHSSAVSNMSITQNPTQAFISGVEINPAYADLKNKNLSIQMVYDLNIRLAGSIVEIPKQQQALIAFLAVVSFLEDIHSESERDWAVKNSLLKQFWEAHKTDFSAAHRKGIEKILNDSEYLSKTIPFYDEMCCTLVEIHPQVSEKDFRVQMALQQIPQPQIEEIIGTLFEKPKKPGQPHLVFKLSTENLVASAKWPQAHKEVILKVFTQAHSHAKEKYLQKLAEWDKSFPKALTE